MTKDEINKKFNWFFKTYIYPKKLWIAFVVVLIFIGSSVGNISPYLYGKMLDSIVDTNIDYLINLIVIYFLVTVSTTLLSILENYIGQMLSFKLVKKSQKDLFEKIIGLKQFSYDKYKSGELLSRLNGDSDSVVSYYLNVITSIMQIIINLAISIYFVLTISVQLSTVALFYIPASFTVTFMSRKFYKILAQKRKKYNDEYYSYLNETFSNNSGIKSFRLEKMISKKFDGFISRELNILKKSIALSAVIQILSTTITVISSLFIIYMSAVLIKSNLLTIGTMVAFNTYINKLFSSISKILSLNISRQEVSVSVERLTEIFSEESEDADKFEYELNEKPNNIKVNGVHFKYENDGEEVLKNLSFNLTNPGFYSFVGKNGCGKSTLAKLLIRLYDTDKGDIKINELKYSTCSIDSIRENITYIQKEDFFLNDTIYNNLKLADENSEREEIYNACKAVGIDEFINSLSDKYETVIGEGGSTLSSGQKQKLNIARALLRKSKVLVFDETTANLDGSAEKEIIALLKEISTNSIIIFISHKASSIVQSDKIFLMDEGYITDSGTHEYLIENNRTYKDLFKNEEAFG